MYFSGATGSILSFFVSVSIVLLLMFAYQWIFVGLVSTIWEEFLKPLLQEWPQVQQLCALQLLHLTIFRRAGDRLLCVRILFAVYEFEGLCFAGQALCGALIFSTFWANIAKDPLPKLENNCTAHLFDEYQILEDGQHGVFYNTMADFPLDFVPLFLTMVFTLVYQLHSENAARSSSPTPSRYAQSDASGTGPRPQLQ
ncbi:unnamed protein product, partial [Mesorhabditis spiculigera]